jgi:hypothetical protein
MCPVRFLIRLSTVTNPAYWHSTYRHNRQTVLQAAGYRCQMTPGCTNLVDQPPSVLSIELTGGWSLVRNDR